MSFLGKIFGKGKDEKGVTAIADGGKTIGEGREECEQGVPKVQRASTEAKTEAHKELQKLKEDAARELERLKKESEREIQRLEEEAYSKRQNRQKADDEEIRALKMKMEGEMQKAKREADGELSRLKLKVDSAAQMAKAEADEELQGLKKKGDREVQMAKKEAEEELQMLKMEADKKAQKTQAEADKQIEKLKMEAFNEIKNMSKVAAENRTTNIKIKSQAHVLLVCDAERAESVDIDGAGSVAVVDLRASRSEVNQAFKAYDEISEAKALEKQYKSKQADAKRMKQRQEMIEGATESQ